MRHLGSIVLSLAGGVLLYLAAGIGAVQLERAAILVADGDRQGLARLATGAGVMLAAGLVLTILLGVRWSPLGSVILGVCLIAIATLTLVRPGLIAEVIPNSFNGVDGLRAASPGLLLMLSVPFILTSASPVRWRGVGARQPLSEHSIDEL